MSSDNTTIIKSSFSIENILSKPNKNNGHDQCQSSSAANHMQLSNGCNDSTNFTNTKIIPKKEPINSDSNCESFGGENTTAIYDDEYRRNSQRSNFTSPDSSCFEEENADNLSDITADESSK